VGLYLGRHAELYDIFYADKPYESEAAFVHQCLQQYGRGSTHRLLELACGTGTHALVLEKLGYQIVATDYSEDMLACARSKAAKVSSNIDFRLKDMRELDLADDPFDAVFCLFDSIGYVVTDEALTQVLQGIHHCLRPEGLFVFEFLHASAVVAGYDPVRIRRWSIPEGELLRISETSLRYAEKLMSVTYTIYELRNDGTYSSLQETQLNRYFSIQEMVGWLSAYSFTPLKWFAGYTRDESVGEQTWHVVGVARRV
jgi:SAM-dependent methyltransferase